MRTSKANSGTQTFETDFWFSFEIFFWFFRTSEQNPHSKRFEYIYNFDRNGRSFSRWSAQNRPLGKMNSRPQIVF